MLDADNELEPEAVCLPSHGEAAPAAIAVVHPLVERVEASPSSDSNALISGVSWQRQHFLERNVVDAMALVRRSAWEQVGGYSHIPGGWEDYDFWCKLIETDFGGILCPQRLARYHCHTGSMLATVPQTIASHQPGASASPPLAAALSRHPLRVAPWPFLVW